jgi:hypothetical protein
MKTPGVSKANSGEAIRSNTNKKAPTRPGERMALPNGCKANPARPQTFAITHSRLIYIAKSGGDPRRKHFLPSDRLNIAPTMISLAEVERIGLQFRVELGAIKVADDDILRDGRDT